MEVCHQAIKHLTKASQKLLTLRQKTHREFNNFTHKFDINICVNKLTKLTQEANHFHKLAFK